MIQPQKARSVTAGRGRALSLIETVVSVFVMGAMLVASLNTVGSARTTEHKLAQRGRGLALARNLMAEILGQAYADPVTGPDSFGLPSDKVGDGSRALWDDVDDYDGWSASPPQQKDGSVMTGLTGWRRSVEVDWVDLWDLSQVVGSNQGVKRINVVVTCNDARVASLTAFRTIATSTLGQ